MTCFSHVNWKKYSVLQMTNYVALTYLQKNDPVLKKIIKKIGYYKPKYFEPNLCSLYKIIISQGLSKEAAEKIIQRFFKNGKVCNHNRLSMMKVQTGRKIGLSVQKIKTIKKVAKQIHNGVLDYSSISKLSDDEIIKLLTTIKGVGPWTAHIFLIFCLRRPDILPVGDIWFAKSIEKEYNFDSTPTNEMISEIASKWKPYRTIGTWYLWKSYYTESRI